MWKKLAGVFTPGSPVATTNRRLAGQKVAWLWKKPYQILAERSASPNVLNILDEVRKFYETGGANVSASGGQD
ncbi:MAG: hypothetical protein PHD72_03880 [Patescibacteria group bacterium]|nr:hypothetical protein [Patescibacteria group bacterium]